MKSYKLTKAGREAIPILQRRDEDEEAEILQYLLNRGPSTVQSVVDDLSIDEATVRIKLVKFERKGWVK